MRGEVGRVVRARSGHIYYDVKDDRNTLACTTWKGQAARLSVQPEEGMEVIVTGRLTAYGAQSKYNMNVEELEVAGAGALMAMLEKRKQQLTAEGLFAPERKKPLPYLPEVIGVVTSPSGAVIRDILHRLRDRFPRRVIIWPVAVQGKPCAPEVANAIRGFNAMPEGAPTPDLIIVARGGGSIEDLWGFNEEIVVRAAAESRIPLISAVGHETDTTLIDYAADQRAPTPTAAAEMAVPVRLDLMGWVDQQGARMTQTLRMGLRQRNQRATDLARALPRPDTLLSQPRQRLYLNTERLPNALRARTNAGRMALSRLEGRMTPNTLRAALRTQNQRLQTATARLAPRAQSQVAALRAKLDALDRMRLSLGYEETLKRGYAVVWGDDAVVTSHKDLKSAETVEIEFADGRKPVTPTAQKKPKQKTPPPYQGSLFLPLFGSKISRGRPQDGGRAPFNRATGP